MWQHTMFCLQAEALKCFIPYLVTWLTSMFGLSWDALYGTERMRQSLTRCFLNFMWDLFPSQGFIPEVALGGWNLHVCGGGLLIFCRSVRYNPVFVHPVCYDVFKQSFLHATQFENLLVSSTIFLQLETSAFESCNCSL